MKKPNITPAPWELDGQNIIGNEQNGYICKWSGRRANAQAIQAVPDMLDALMEAKDQLEHVQSFSGYSTKVATTIAHIDMVLEKAGVEL